VLIESSVGIAESDMPPLSIVGPSGPRQLLSFHFRAIRAEVHRMPLTMQQVGPCFVGEVGGIDLTAPLLLADISAIHAGMDKYAVLIFHEQNFTDEQQLAFTQSLAQPSKATLVTRPLLYPVTRKGALRAFVVCR
jgi:hypothetical protein